MVITPLCATEWITSGAHGFVVDPHDVEELANAIRRAAEDEGLVGAAAPRNRAEVERRWNPVVNPTTAFEAYRALEREAL